MNRENAHIESYLDYYCCLKKAPGFAVMLTGTPGVGKSWLIDQYKKKLKSLGCKSLYVSLFGMNSLSDLENAFYEQLNPALSGEGMGLSAKILKEAIKSTINLELKREKLATTTSDQYVVPDYLINAREYILLIDDVDRCFLPIPEVFGFFNFLLEHHGFKIILAANEVALKEREDNRHIQELVYQRVKDKVVGRSFEVKADFAEAFNHVMDYLGDNPARNFLRNNRPLLREIFIKSAPSNLRHLQHSLLDFERLFSALPPETLAISAFLNQLLTVFMIFSLEIRAKNIQPEDLKGIRLEFHAQLFAKFVVYERKSPQSYLLEKYRKYNVQDTLCSEDWWVNFFLKGKVDVAEIAAELQLCPLFFPDDLPAIHSLTMLWALTDKEFQNLNRKIQIEISAKKYTDPGAIKLATSYRLWASEQGIIDKTRPEIVDEAKKYVEALFSNHLLTPDRKLAADDVDLKSWHGIPFFTVEMPEFVEFCAYLDQVNQKCCHELLSHEADEILEKLKNRLEDFCSIITFSGETGLEYKNLPVLCHIQPEVFLKAFLALKPEQQLFLAQSLQERYHLSRSNRYILPEAKWLETMIILLKKEALDKKGFLSSFTLKTMVEKFLEPSLEKLETLQMEKIE